LGATVKSTKCSAGYYCSTPTTKTLCPAGSQCPEGSSASILCEKGYYQPNTHQDSCEVCPEGYYCPDEGMTTAYVCPVGHYCAKGSSVITTCEIGTFNQLLGVGNSAGCQDCIASYYCSVAGMTDIDSSSRCAAGFYCPARSVANNANACGKGEYCPASSVAPIECPVGTYSD